MRARWPRISAFVLSCCASPTFARATQTTLHDVFAACQEDVTEENIQARARGSLLMALSNKLNAIVLSHRQQERDRAWATARLYGDMVGGLAVISDVPKTLVYRLSRYVNSLRPVIPEASLEKPPSAELRPDQKDSDSLPPYDVLDAILEDYVEDSHSAEQIAKRARLRSRLGAACAAHGGSRGVQAAAGRAGNQNFRKSFWLRQALSDRRKVGGLTASRPWDVCISTHLKGTHAP